MSDLLPKPLIVTLGLALAGIVLVTVGGNGESDAAVMAGILLLIAGGPTSALLFVYYLVRPPKQPATPPRKGGFAKRFAGVCMFGMGIGILICFAAFLLFPERRNEQFVWLQGLNIVRTTLISLCFGGVLLYSGWQMMTGKV